MAADVVARGGVEPPTFRFSGRRPAYWIMVSSCQACSFAAAPRRVGAEPSQTTSTCSSRAKGASHHSGTGTWLAVHAVPVHPQTRWDGWYHDDAPLEWLADRGLRGAAREAASGPLVEEKVLVHGDYQHFNVLWCDGRLSGVVDWPNAATGNLGSDVGHCRLNFVPRRSARDERETWPSQGRATNSSAAQRAAASG